MRFENLDVWKRAARMSADLHKALEESRRRPACEPSEPAGTSPPGDSTPARRHPDRVKSLTYAKGSCGEVRTQLYISMEAGILPRDKGRAWTEETRHLSAMLYGLIKTMRQTH